MPDNRFSPTAIAALLLAAHTGCVDAVDAVTAPKAVDGFIDRNGNEIMEPYENRSLARRARVDDLLLRLSLDQKIGLVSGIGYASDEDDAQDQSVPGAAGFTYPVEELGIPSMALADGPAGVRIWPNREGTEQTFYATAFPVETALSSSWDLELVEEVGKAFGQEVREYGIDLLLAPGMNIHRDPRGGRNFEYYSEDPLLSGRLAAAMVRGVQSEGVGATPKHYVANNQETNRYLVDTIVSERALREIYLRGFEIVIEESDPWSIMSAYNQVNGVPASQHTELLTTVLRDEWGFGGVVMTDWFAGMDDTVSQMKAGNELLMPGMPDGAEQIRAAIESGELSAEIIDRNVGRILDVILRSPAWKSYEFSNEPDLDGNATLARRAAAEGTVLLKNDDGTLPFSDQVQSAAVFGNQSYDFISGGTGSGDVNEAYTVSLVAALNSRGVAIDEPLRNAYEAYLESYAASLPEKERFWEFEPPAPERDVSEEDILALAGQYDTALITIGRKSGEFQDRPLQGDFYFTSGEKNLIANVSSAFRDAGKKTTVILNIGNVVETVSWRDIPDAIVVPWQGGQEAGNAVLDVLFGDVNPSAKLPTTFPKSYDDTPTARNFPGFATADETVNILGVFEAQPSQVNYEEGIYVGYRYYDKAEIPVAYPFGYGLSYTTFGYGSIKAGSDSFEDTYKVSIKVTNTGAVPGREIAQLYISAPEGELGKPRQELRHFAKTGSLAPGESETLTFEISPRDLASFHPARRAWIAEPGTYRVRIGSSSKDIHSTRDVKLAKEIVVQRVLANLAPEAPLDELEF